MYDLYIAISLMRSEKSPIKLLLSATVKQSAKFHSVQNISMDELIQRMIGRELKEMYPKEYFAKGKKVLEVINFLGGASVYTWGKNR